MEVERNGDRLLGAAGYDQRSYYDLGQQQDGARQSLSQVEDRQSERRQLVRHGSFVRLRAGRKWSAGEQLCFDLRGQWRVRLRSHHRRAVRDLCGWNGTASWL